MPSKPRSAVFRAGEPGVYHCYNRCVRRAFLCGVDPVTKQNFQHRRGWIVSFERELAKLFGVEVCFHAEMINHIHLILRVLPHLVAKWSDEEVVRRWLTISHLVRSKDGKTIKPLSDKRIAKELADPEKIAETRRKLASISSFMGALCEHIARRANAEDGVTGKFWESRFKCRDLADEAAILCCGIYVDLNQVRAGEAETPAASRHTSAYERMLAWRTRERDGTTDVRPSAPASGPADWLCELTLGSKESDATQPAASGQRATDRGLLPIRAADYFELLEATARMVQTSTAESLPADLPPLLERLEKQGVHVNAEAWDDTIRNFGTRFGDIVGRTATLAARAAAAGRKWFRGKSRCEESFG